MYSNTYSHPKSRLRTYPTLPVPTEAKSDLYNELSFYKAFADDLGKAKREVIIYSPFVSKYRAEMVYGQIVKLTQRNIDVFIFTRPVEEYERNMQNQIQGVLQKLEEAGAFVYCLPGTIHEKVAIIDRETLWEGSLNILSQRQSREMMRRSANENMANQVVRYLRLEHRLADGYKKKYERLYRSLLGETQSSHTKKRNFILFCSLLAVFGVLAILSATPHQTTAILQILKVLSFK